MWSHCQGQSVSPEAGPGTGLEGWAGAERRLEGTRRGGKGPGEGGLAGQTPRVPVTPWREQGGMGDGGWKNHGPWNHGKGRG